MNYWTDDIQKIYDRQRRKGIETYGQTLEDNNKLSIQETIEMAQEEAVDLLMYLSHLKFLTNQKIVGQYIYEVDYESETVRKYLVQDISLNGIKYADDWQSLTNIGASLFFDEHEANKKIAEMRDFLSHF